MTRDEMPVPAFKCCIGPRKAEVETAFRAGPIGRADAGAQGSVRGKFPILATPVGRLLVSDRRATQARHHRESDSAGALDAVGETGAVAASEDGYRQARYPRTQALRAANRFPNPGL